MTIKLIIGLRNPGSAYEQTRHNAGGWFVERLALQYQASFKSEKKLHCDLANFDSHNTACKLALPLTYMNHSGQPTREICQFYRITPHEILIAHDDLDLEAGRIKLKTGGGHGGHNGLRDIMTQLGTGDFHRLRIGIGHPGQRELVHDYVLGKPSQHHRQLIIEAIDRAIDIAPIILTEPLGMAMNRLNT